MLIDDSQYARIYKCTLGASPDVVANCVDAMQMTGRSAVLLFLLMELYHMDIVSV